MTPSARLPFHPFTIACQTCTSKLNVTDPSVVGTIVACPKCGSMVQVDRPSPQVALGTADVDSQAITQEAIQPPEGSVADSTDIQENADRFQHADSVPAPEVGMNTVDAPPSEPWQSEKTQRSRQIGLVVALSTGSLFIALLIFGLFVRSWSSKTADSNSGGEATASVEAEPEQEDPNVAESTDTADQPTGPETDSGDGDPLPTNDAMPDSTPSDPPPMAPTDPESSDSKSTDTASAEAAQDASATRTDSSEIPNDLMPRSPLLGASDATTKSPDAPAPDGTGGLQDLPPGLAEFTNLIDLANDGGIREATIEAPPSMEETEIEGPADELIDPMMIATPPPPINMKRGLATQMALALTNEEGYPLADLVLLISQITGIPVQLDWVSFDIAGIDVRTPIKTSKGWKNASEVLEEIADLTGARVEPQESMILITPTEEAFGSALQAVLSLDDFGPDRESAADVIHRFLMTDVKDQPTNKVAIGPTRADQQLAAIAAETVRQMRGLPPKMQVSRLARWTQSAEQKPESWNILNKVKSGPQYDAPVAIAEVLRRVARDNDASCIVNWHDARRRRLSPEQLTLPFAGSDGGDELARTLEPFGMQIRKVDKHHWWIGTAATYDRLPLVIWTQPLGLQRDAFQRQIHNIMSGADKDSFRIAIDSQSDRAMLLLPRFVVRQLPAIQAKLVAK